MLTIILVPLFGVLVYTIPFVHFLPIYLKLLTQPVNDDCNTSSNYVYRSDNPIKLQVKHNFFYSTYIFYGKLIELIIESTEQTNMEENNASYIIFIIIRTTSKLFSYSTCNTIFK